MNPLVRDAYIFFLGNMARISQDGLKVFASTMMDNCSLSRCFRDEEYVSEILKDNIGRRISKDPRPDFRSSK